jgi:hypothetical protein
MSQRFADAALDFKASYELVPTRQALFAWAQAARLMGDCDTAIPLYRRYLDSNPTERQALAAKQHLESCGPGGSVATPSQQVQGAPVSGPHRSWYQDPLGLGLLGGAGVTVGVGTWALIASLHVPPRAADYQLHADQMGQLTAWRIASIAAFAGTGVLISLAWFRFHALVPGFSKVSPLVKGQPTWSWSFTWTSGWGIQLAIAG